MTTLNERLRAADPGRADGTAADDARSRMRQAVLAASAADRAPSLAAGATRRGRLRVALAAVLVATAALAFQLWQNASQPAFAAVRLEIRLAEDAPAPGLREAPVGSQPRLVYLHDEVVVTNEDVAEARVVPGRDGGPASVAVVFTPAGAAKLHAATAGHLGRPVAVSIDGLVVMAPVVRSPIGDRAVVSGDFNRDDAERIARGLAGR